MNHPTASQSDEFGDKIPKFVTNNMIAVRCRIWKCVGEFSDSMMCVSCSRIFVERSVTAWRIENFSSLDAGKNCIHEIKSVRTREHLMSLKLLPCKLNSDPFQCDITPRKRVIKSCKITFVPSVTSGKLHLGLEGFYKFDVPGETKRFIRHPSFQRRLMEDKHLFLPKDVLSLLCICEFCYGVVLEEDIFTCEINVEKFLQQNGSVSEDNPCSTSSTGLDIERLIAFKKPASDALHSASEINVENMLLRNVPVPEDNPSSTNWVVERLVVVGKPASDALHSTTILSDIKDSKHLSRHFACMLYDNTHSDVNLRTGCGTYPAHKCVLRVRSPVFGKMFPRGSEGNSSIDIEDLDDHTVCHMLWYIYSGEIVKLRWDIAFGLYAAAAKYKLLVLKDICSSYLKKHLCLDNAFELSQLAAQYQNDDLNDFVQDFVSKRSQFSRVFKSFRRGSSAVKNDLQTASAASLNEGQSLRAKFRRVVKRFRPGSFAVKNDLQTASCSEDSRLVQIQKISFSLREEQSVAVKNALIEDFKTMPNRMDSDISLKTSSKTYYVHQCVLSAWSPVFRTMLLTCPRVIDMEDTDGDTVGRMVRYIYTGEVKELGWDSATRLYAFSNKYELSELKRVCSSYLKEHLCQSNTHETLQLLNLHPDKDLENFVLDFVTENIEDFSPQERSQLLLETVKLKVCDAIDSDTDDSSSGSD
ncbi:hypothetical protein AVEN_242062-1 [Araneus ventricosus]|uniref:BTB domain-containing protein n=1 Tax=Araneus ventricosus TaxID=182803 RepID=A0A4Y2R570_ARAVE|nr:hypothetical protein AVEN_242062-1 [Araneus ventricosus]